MTRADLVLSIRWGRFGATAGEAAPAILALSLAACAANQSLPPETVFDPAGLRTASAPVDTKRNPEIERAVPGLDRAVAGGDRWRGVSVLDDGVRFARPARWRIRDASFETSQSFVRYVSPKAYSFAIYERADSANSSWREILEHYEAEVAATGAKAIGARIPVATETNQGRAYTIDRVIEGKDPVLSRSREILVRGDHRVVLVQIVTSEESLAQWSDELLQVLEHIEVR